MEKKITILSTRNLTNESVDRLNAANIFVQQKQFIETKIINDNQLSEIINALAQQKIHVIFTSANAVESVAEKLLFQPNWNIFCLAGKTKQTIEKFFTKVKIIHTAENGKSLAIKIIESENPMPIVFFCGNKRMNTMPEMLVNKGFQLQELVVYKTILTPKKINDTFDGILFFSPSAVESFFSENKIQQNKILFSIGKSTSEAIKNFSEKIVETTFPSEKKMVETVVDFYRNTTIKYED